MTSKVIDSLLPPSNTDRRKLSGHAGGNPKEASCPQASTFSPGDPSTFWNGEHLKMRRTISMAILLISLLAVIPSQAQAKDTGDVDAVKQVEVGMGDAMVAGDIYRLNQL